MIRSRLFGDHGRQQIPILCINRQALARAIPLDRYCQIFCLLEPAKLFARRKRLPLAERVELSFLESDERRLRWLTAGRHRDKV